MQNTIMIIICVLLSNAHCFCANFPKKLKSTHNIDKMDAAFLKINLYVIHENNEVERIKIGVQNNVNIYLNGFYISPWAAFRRYFQIGRNEFKIIFTDKSFLKSASSESILRFELASKKIYRKYEVKFIKSTNVYTWGFQVDEMSYRLHWNNAKFLKRLTSQNIHDLKQIVNKEIDLFSKENLLKIEEFENKYYQTQYKDIIASSRLSKAYWCNDFFKKNFCGKRRLLFIKNNKFSIDLNIDNKKVVNVIAIGETPLYKITSKDYMSFGKTKNYLRWQSYGLNFISIDGEWQIY